MNSRHVARTLSLGRIGFGIALMALPERTTELWIGKQSRKPVPQMFTRAVGARDLGLGAATIAAASRRGPLRPLLLAALLADSTDLIATLVARDHLPRTAVPLVVATAGAGIALGALGLAGAGNSDAPPPPVPA